MLSIIYQNVRGLKSKLTTLYVDSFNFEYDIIAFTETWLHESIFSSEILCSKYQIFRCDRHDITKKTGGGVLIAVSMKFSSERIEILNTTGIEIVAVKIDIKKTSKLYLACSYIPPRSDASTYTNHLSAIQSAFCSAKFSDVLVALGDFNLPSILWEPSLNDDGIIPVNSNEFIVSLLSFGLFQVNNIYNSSNRLLDLIFVNRPSDLSASLTLPVTLPEDRFHPTLKLQLSLPSLKSEVPSCSLEQRSEFYFPKTDYNKLNSLLAKINWVDVLSSRDFDNQVENFYKVMHECFSQSVPKCHKNKITGPPWKTKQLAKLKNKKKQIV